MAAFDGPAQKMKHWRSPQTSIKCWCRGWKLLPETLSGKSRIQSSPY